VPDQHFRTEKRVEKIKWVLSKRQPSLRVVIENIHDPHNISAIFRTCDAAGITKVSLIYTVERFPKIGKKSSASAYKWIEREKFKSVEECYNQLRKEKFKQKIYTI
jgi:tRNA (guanosine-2'-O-)-methyltransferase